MSLLYNRIPGLVRATAEGQLPSAPVIEANEHIPTTDVLRSRLATDSMPGNRSDGFRVALAVEGGGMRAVVSSGMLLALEQLGFGDAFDLRDDEAWNARIKTDRAQQLLAEHELQQAAAGPRGGAAAAGGSPLRAGRLAD